MNQHTTNCKESACDGRCMEQTDRIAKSAAAINAMVDDATNPNRPHIGIESVGEYLRRLEKQLDESALSWKPGEINNKMAFVTDLAALLNKHNIDTQLDMPDDILALMFLQFMQSMAKARILSQRRKLG